MRSNYTKGRSLCVRAISVFVAWTFLCSCLPFSSSQAFAQSTDSSNVREGTDTSLLASAFASSGKVQELIVPPGLGSVQESFPGSSNLTQSPVILIQDAHAVPDAQRSLEKLVEYFQGKYGVKTVALEGAEGKLDATLFRLFPDVKKRNSVFNEYLGSGELSGAAVASVLSPHKAEYVGIEDWKLYQEGVAAFLDGLQKQSDLKAKSATLKGELRRLKIKYYSKNPMELDAQLTAWNEKPEDLSGLLNFLAERHDVLTTPSERFARYPAVRAVIQSLKNENIPEGSKLDQEIKGLLVTPGPQLKEQERFNQLKQSFQTGRIGRAEFAYEVHQLTGDWPFSPALRTLINGREKLAALKGAAFLDELETLLEEVKEECFASPEEKGVAKLDGQLQRLEKLGKFELSRKEWNEIRAMRKARCASGAVETKELQMLEGDIFAILNSQETAIFFSFYEIAIKREAVFMEKISELRRAPYPVSGMVFVAGGFHTDGLAAKLKEKGIPYVVVSPAMKEVPQDHRYFDHMRGEVSWQKYFRTQDGKVDLYDAFTRATTAELLKDEKRFIAKEWRDSLIRQLAAEGRVAEHSGYTHFVDQQAAEGTEKFQVLKEKWTAKLEKFIESLRFLHGKNQLTEPEIIQLLSRPANQTPVAVASFVPGNNVPQSFFCSREVRSAIGVDGAPMAAKRAEIRSDEAGAKPDFETPSIRGFEVNGKKSTPDQFRAKVQEMEQGGFTFKTVIRNGTLRLGVISFGEGDHGYLSKYFLKDFDDLCGVVYTKPEHAGDRAQEFMLFYRSLGDDPGEMTLWRDQAILVARVFVNFGFPREILLDPATDRSMERIYGNPNPKTLGELAGLSLSSEDSRSEVRTGAAVAGKDSSSEAPAVDGRAEKSSLSYWLGGKWLKDRKAILDAAFGAGAAAWLSGAVAFNGSKEARRDAVLWLSRNREFLKALGDPAKDPWIEAIRAMVKGQIPFGTKAMQLFSRDLKPLLPGNPRGDILPSHISFSDYFNFIAALGHGTIQGYFSSPEFLALPGRGRLKSVMKKIRSLGLPMVTDEYREVLRALPKDIRERLRSGVVSKKAGAKTDPVGSRETRREGSWSDRVQDKKLTAREEAEVFKDVLSRIRGLQSYAAIEEQLIRLRARGKKVFNVASVRKTMSRRSNVYDRLVFLWEILGYRDLAGRSLVTVGQATQIEKSYGPGNAGLLRENIRWLMDQEADDGKPLFSTVNIRFCLLQGTHFKKEVFKALWTLFEGTDLPPGAILNYMAYTDKMREAFHEWEFWPMERWLHGAQRLRFSMLRKTQVDAEHVLGLTKILFREKAGDLQKYIKRSVAEDRVLLEGVEKGGSLSDAVIKRLVLSFSVDVRRKIIDLVYAALTDVAAMQGRLDAWDGMELSSAHLLGYKWTRPNAGLANLIRNIGTVERYRRSLDQPFEAEGDRNLYRVLRSNQHDPLEMLIRREELILAGAQVPRLTYAELFDKDDLRGPKDLQPIMAGKHAVMASKRSEIRSGAAAAVDESPKVAGQEEKTSLPYWLRGKRMTNRQEILETIFGQGAVAWFEGVAASKRNVLEIEKAAQWLITNEEFLKALKSSASDPWVEAVRILIRSGKEYLGTPAMRAFSEKVVSLLPDADQQKITIKRVSFLQYAEVMTALGDMTIQRFLSSEEFVRLDRFERTRRLLERIQDLGFSLGVESVGAFFTALPEDVRSRMGGAKSKATVQDFVASARREKPVYRPTPNAPYWLAGRRLRDRGAILVTAFGEGVDAWFEGVAGSVWNEAATEKTARWLAANTEFLAALGDPLRDPWLEAVRILIMNKKNYIGTRSLKAFSRMVQRFLPDAYKRKVTLKGVSFLGYADTIAAFGHESMQDFLGSIEFERIAKPDRIAALVKKIQGLELPLRLDGPRAFYNALPKEVYRRVARVDTSLELLAQATVARREGEPVASYWLQGRRSVDKREILETVFGEGAAGWFDRAGKSEWNPVKMEKTARALTENPEYLKILKDSSKDPWVEAIRILIREGPENLGTQSFKKFSTKVLELLPEKYRGSVTVNLSGFSGYADEIAALGQASIQEYILSDEFEKLDRSRRTVALARKVLNLGLPLGTENLKVFYMALPKDIRSRMARVEGMIIASGSKKFVAHDGNPVTSYWLRGKFLTDRNAILNEAFGAGAAGWLNNAVSYSGTRETRREAVLWLSENKEFLEALADPSKDPWIEAVRAMVTAKRSFGTKSMQLFSEALRQELPEGFRANLYDSQISFSAYFDLIAASGHGAIQKYLASRGFLRLPQNRRAEAFVKKIRDLGLPLRAGAHESVLIRNLPRDILGRVRMTAPSPVETDIPLEQRTAREGSLTFFEKNRGLTDRVKILDGIFGQGAERWFDEAARSAGSNERLKGSVDWLMKNEEFQALLNDLERDASLDPWIETVRIMVTHRRNPGTKTMVYFSERLRDALAERFPRKRFQRIFQKVRLPFLVYGNEIAGLGHASVQELLSSRAFADLDENERALALFRKCRQKGLWLGTDNLGQFFSGLPKEIRDRVAEINLPLERLEQIQRTMTDERVRSFIGGPMMTGRDRPARLLLLINEIRRMGLPLGPVTPAVFYSALPRYARERMNIEKLPFGAESERAMASVHERHDVLQAAKSPQSGAIRDVLLTLRGMRNYAAIAEQLGRLRARGEKIFSNVQELEMMSRRPDVYDRIVFLGEMLGYTDRAGRNLFSVGQVVRVANFPDAVKFDAIKENILWMLEQGTDDGNPMFRPSDIRFCVISGKKFKKEVFEELWELFGGTEMPPRVLLNYMIRADKVRQAFQDWQSWPFERWLNSTRRIRFFMLSRTQVDVKHVLGLTEILFPGKANDLQAYIRRSVAEDKALIESIKAGAVLSDDVIKRLVVSFSADIRGEIIALVYLSLADAYAKKGQLDVWDGMEFSHAYIRAYEWMRPTAGLANLARNIQIIEEHQRRSLDQTFGPDTDRNLHSVLVAKESDPLERMLHEEEETGLSLAGSGRWRKPDEPFFRNDVRGKEKLRRSAVGEDDKSITSGRSEVRTGLPAELEAFIRRTDIPGHPLEKEERQRLAFLFNRTLLLKELRIAVRNSKERTFVGDGGGTWAADRYSAQGIQLVHFREQEHLRRGFSMLLNEHKKMIGYGVSTRHGNDAERVHFRFQIFPEYRAKGLATRGYGAKALALMLNVLYHEKGFIPAEAFIVSNLDSWADPRIAKKAVESGFFRFLQKHGFVPEVENADPNKVDLVFEMFENKAAKVSRSEVRRQKICEGILGTLLMQKPVAEGMILEFAAEVRSDFAGTVEGLRDAFNKTIIPEAAAKIVSRETRQEDSAYGAFEQALSDRSISKVALERLAEHFYRQSLDRLAEAIRNREVGGMAPVVFYSPEMKERLFQFIEVVQKSSEAVGDVTGQNYRITLVSRNKAALLNLKTELSKRGSLRGVHFEEDGRSLGRDVFQSARFKESFGVFFPDEPMAAGISPWQRVVNSQVPKEWGVLLLPALSRYFAVTKTSDINAITLKQALPDLFGSVEFKIGQGVQIILGLLVQVMAAEKQFAVSA